MLLMSEIVFRGKYHIKIGALDSLQEYISNRLIESLDSKLKEFKKGYLVRRMNVINTRLL